MTHKSFISTVQKMCHIDGQQCSMLLSALCRLMAQAGVEQVPVTLHGLGTFVSHKHPEYIQEDTQTGRQTLYPPRITYRMQNEQEGWEVNPLVRQLSDSANTSQADCSKFLDALVSTIHHALQKDEEAEVHGLGTFRIISTHQGDLHRIAFSPDDSMRQAVNAPFSCFEPVPLSINLPAAAIPVVEEEEEEEPVAVVVPVAAPIEAPVEVPEEAPVEAEVESPANPQPELDDEVDDEDFYMKNQNTSTIGRLGLTCAALVCIVLICFGWFIYNLETETPQTPALAEGVESPSVPCYPTSFPASDSEKVAALQDDHKLPVSTPAETKPVETKPAETKPAETKPVETKPVETKPVETKPAEVKPAEAKPSETKPSETKPVVTKPASTEVVWKIQFLTSQTLYESGDRKVGGLSPISYYKEGNFYKYTYGSASSKEALKADMEKVRKKFKDAFYVRFDSQGNRLGYSSGKK